MSHSSVNRRFAKKLAAVLTDHNLPVWYSTTNLRGASEWHDQIGSALRRCDWFLVVLSPDAVTSPWVKRELTYALNDRRFSERIVPVLYRACNAIDLSWVLGGIQTVDFRRKHEDGYRALLKVWGRGYQA